MLVNTPVVAQKLTDCATCSSKVIQSEQIKELSIDELRFLTNDLFAREGYKFKADDINAFFSEKPWYKPKKDNKQVVFNAIEKQNIELFQNRTVVLKAVRDKLMNELKSLQQVVNNDNKQELQQRFGFDPSKEHEYEFLVKAMKKLDFNDMNWFKDTGFYELTIDNGDRLISYDIRIEGSRIRIMYSQRGVSSIAREEAIYPIGNWVAEFNHLWIFEFNGKLQFAEYHMAG